MPKHPSYLNFDKARYPWRPEINYRQEPERYLVGKGEQGVLICQPYKDELSPHWRFKDADIARKSSKKIYELFLHYLAKGEFVGADLARKFLQMGFTRARRYANYKGGRKYDKNRDYAKFERGSGEDEKAEAASIFYKKWQEAENNAEYKKQKALWQDKHG